MIGVYSRGRGWRKFEEVEWIEDLMIKGCVEFEGNRGVKDDLN